MTTRIEISLDIPDVTSEHVEITEHAIIITVKSTLEVEPSKIFG